MAEHRARRHRWFGRHHPGKSSPPLAPQN
jgi:hypothetical protein